MTDFVEDAREGDRAREEVREVEPGLLVVEDVEGLLTSPKGEANEGWSEERLILLII